MMTLFSRKVAKVLAIGSLLVTVTACGESLDQTGDDAEPTEDGGRESWPETVTYGLLPTDDMDDLVALYTPLEEYMATCLDHPFELFPGTDYTAMVEAMRTGSVHLARFGPFSYILAHERADAEALAVAVEEAGEATYRSLIITRKSNGFESLADLEGRSFAFVDPASASGHLYPRALVIDEMGITNEEVETWFGDVVYAGNHEASLLSVLNGDTDAGALASNASAIVENDGVWEISPDAEFGAHPNADDFTVLAESEVIPRTVEAIKGDLPDSLKDAVMGCLQGASEEPSLAEFREEGGLAGGFAPAADGDYDVVRDTAAALGMSPEDLLDQ